ncbi:MAG TPA: hypothetical protein PLI09_12175 [Candidatus Hydrogenedentes bacterium]|nr:hypothetical protein [Candidatus Hydrogenedentota bacterium]
MMDALDNLSHEEALWILKELCKTDAKIRIRILAEAEKLFMQVDRDAVAEDVFFELDGLNVDELWDRSGPHRHGYSSPDEMAVEMIEEALKPYEDKIQQYQKMGMPEQAKQYCMGVLKGIYQFEHEAQSEFKEQAPDLAAECFGGILDEWRERCTRKEDIQAMNAFMGQECSEWAKWAIKDGAE